MFSSCVSIVPETTYYVLSNDSLKHCLKPLSTTEIWISDVKVVKTDGTGPI